MIKSILKTIAQTFGPTLSNFRLISTFVIITFCMCVLLLFSVFAVKLYYMQNSDSILIILLSFLTSVLTIIITGKVQQKKTELNNGQEKEADTAPATIKN